MHEMNDMLSSLCVYCWIFVLTRPVNPAGTLVQMLTKGQMLILKSGEDVDLQCEFFSEDFSLFDNPIFWRKAQRMEESQINMMGNLLEPFSSAKRFQATFQKLQPRFIFGLSIHDLSLEDNGNYTCLISGPHNTVLASVTHYIFVRAPVDRVFITDQNTTTFEPSRQANLFFSENHSGILRCVALGGSPPPDIDVYLGHQDITSRFVLSRSPTLTRKKGLRLVYYTTERSARQFLALPEDDGKLLRCVVSVPGSPSNETVARISVHYAAVITCEESAAFLGDKNVYIRCEVRAKPKPDAMFWIVDLNGTTVSEGEVISGYWMLVMDRTDDVIETQLFMKQTYESTFKRYTLVVENSISVRTRDVILNQKFRTTAKAEYAKQKTYYNSKHESNSNIGIMFVRNGCSTVRNVQTVVSKQYKQFLTILVLLLFCVRFDDVTVR